ncbi:MAG: tetratricopeptide repeat protein [Limisphaerales bacterium]
MSLILLAATIIAYQPVWHAGFIWDDDIHVTPPELRSWNGLARIWFQLGATHQYYPLLHTVFWAEHWIWGDAPLGYHLINVLLHVLGALLLVKVLRQLHIPGAWFAAALFALHPVEVESVAWVSELKNTLSGVFYLGSALCYLRFDQGRKRMFYLGSLGLFAAGLLSKSVIATLPAALLLLLWWRCKRLRWKDDVLPLAPFFIVGMGMGLLTAWVERTIIIGSDASSSHLSLAERFLVPGRAVWFYLGKLCWPHPLIFIYPRWEVDGARWQFLFPAALLTLGARLWKWRHSLGDGPLVSMLFMIGTLFPALGFLDVYPFRYAFVADHFQYLASLGPLTLAGAGLAGMINRSPVPGFLFCAGLLAILGALTRHQCEMYASQEALWRETIAQNPGCWMAYDNLGVCFLAKGETDQAIAQYRKALEIKPDYERPYYNLGLALFRKGELDAAVAQYRKALEIKPDFVMARSNLGLAFDQEGNTDEAIAQFRKALEIQPENAGIRVNLGNALFEKGQYNEAIEEYQKALAINPASENAHFNLGIALFGKGDVEEAIAQYQQALKIRPDDDLAYDNLGLALAKEGWLDEAIASYSQALKINPRSADIDDNLGVALARKGKTRAAIDSWQQALEIHPDRLSALNNLAWPLATSADASLRDGKKAIALATRASQLTGGGNPIILHTLAAAYAETGRYGEAKATARHALELAVAQNNDGLIAKLEKEIKLYEANRPVRDVPQ